MALKLHCSNPDSNPYDLIKLVFLAPILPLFLLIMQAIEPFLVPWFYITGAPSIFIVEVKSERDARRVPETITVKLHCSNWGMIASLLAGSSGRMLRDPSQTIGQHQRLLRMPVAQNNDLRSHKQNPKCTVGNQVSFGLSSPRNWFLVACICTGFEMEVLFLL